MENVILDIFSQNHIIVNLLIGFFLIVIESIIPVLPLGIFITVNTILFGPIVGFIISYLGTMLGCTTSFVIADKCEYKIENTKFKKWIEKINNTKFSNLVVITAFPFTPAFIINIASGLSYMTTKKFIVLIAISKLAIVYFWTYIGTTLIESITDIRVIIKLVGILLITYLLSKLATKEFKIK